MSVALTGGAVGAGVAVLLRGIGARKLASLSGAVVVTLAAFAVAHFGKMRFAASFGEDAFAGQMWYFGWIAAAAFATLTLALLPKR